MIEFTASGKAPKKYGTDTYRFGASLTLSVILPRRGWTLVKQTKNYAYIKPPADQPGPNFRISIAVPPASECLAIARRCHARAESWAYQLGEWPAWYLHERKRDMRRLWRDPVRGEMASELHPAPPESSLSIGQWGIWEMHVTGIAGEFAIGRAPSATTRDGSLDVLTEGEPKTVELTKGYEVLAACAIYVGILNPFRQLQRESLSRGVAVSAPIGAAFAFPWLAVR